MQQSKNGIIAWSLRCSQNKKNSPQNVENFIFHAVKNLGANTAIYLKRVWPFWDVMDYRFKAECVN